MGQWLLGHPVYQHLQKIYNTKTCIFDQSKLIFDQFHLKILSILTQNNIAVELPVINAPPIIREILKFSTILR